MQGSINTGKTEGDEGAGKLQGAEKKPNWDEPPLPPLTSTPIFPSPMLTILF